MITNMIVQQRKVQLFLERNVPINNLGNICGTTGSTTNNIAIGCSNNAIATTLKKLYDSLDTTIEEFCRISA